MPDTNQQTSQHQLLRRYLLGDLSEPEQELTEQLYFTEDDYLNQLLLAETELLESYLSGSLTVSETNQFERNYLTTPEKRLRLRLIERIQIQANEAAKAEVDFLSDRAELKKAPWWQAAPAVFLGNAGARFAFALAMLIVLVGVVFLVNRNSQLQRQLARSEQEKINFQENDAQLREQLAEQLRQEEQRRQPLDQGRQQVQSGEHRNAELQSQLARAEQEKNRVRENQRELKGQLAEQQQRTEQLAKSLAQANEERRELDERAAQLRNQIARAEQERIRLGQNEEQLRQRLAEQQQRTELIAKSLAQATEERRLLGEEISRRQNASAPPLPSLELGSEPVRSSLFSLRSNRRQPPLLVISKEAKMVHLTFKTDTLGFQSYRVLLLSADGGELWTRADELEDGRPISLYLPSSFLDTGDFTFVLRLQKADGGVENRYPVRVQRR